MAVFEDLLKRLNPGGHKASDVHDELQSEELTAERALYCARAFIYWAHALWETNNFSQRNESGQGALTPQWCLSPGFQAATQLGNLYITLARELREHPPTRP